MNGEVEALQHDRAFNAGGARCYKQIAAIQCALGHVVSTFEAA